MVNRIKDIIKFWNSTADEHMNAFAAQSAFFIFLSFFPIVNLIIAIPKLLPFSQEQMMEILYYVLPRSFEEFIGGLVTEMYEYSSNSITIISLVIAVWSAAKGLTAVRYGLNEVYRSREARNYLIIRSISAVYTIVFVIIVLLLVPLNMFGTQIALYIFNQFPHFTDVTLLVYSIRSSATFILLFVLFVLMYTIVPSKKLKLRKQVPGALVAAFFWVSFTKLFSLYIDYYASRSFMYGSMTTVVMFMFWMYFVIYSIFIGAQVNEYLHFCRKRNEELELDKYNINTIEHWEDDEIDDSEDNIFADEDEELEALLEEIFEEDDKASKLKAKKIERIEAINDKVTSITDHIKKEKEKSKEESKEKSKEDLKDKRKRN